MRNYIRIGLIVFLSIFASITMGPLYATSPQKSTIITLTNESISIPRICAGDLGCELRNANVDFILRHGQVGKVKVVLFDLQHVKDACHAGDHAEREVVILLNGMEYACSLLDVGYE